MLEANKRRNRAAGGRRWRLEGIKAHKGMRVGNGSLGRDQKPCVLDFGLVCAVCFAIIFVNFPIYEKMKIKVNDFLAVTNFHVS